MTPIPTSSARRDAEPRRPSESDRSLIYSLAILQIPAQGGGGPEVDEGQTEALVGTQVPRAKPQRQRHEPQGVTAGEYGTLHQIAEALERSRLADERVREWIEGRVK